jgi:sporulation protein YabP
MPVEDKKVMKMQNIILENRGKLNVSGVLDVLNFDEQTVTIDTELGLLIVKGTDLRLNKFNLDNTELIIEGEVNSLTYNDKGYGKKGESLLSKIFK